MMCKQVREELLASWGSTDALASEAREHLRECEECHFEAIVLQRTRVLLHSLPTQRAPERLTERVLARIARDQTGGAWRSWLAAWFVPEGQPAWARAAAVGMALALAVAGGAIYSGHQQSGVSNVPVLSPIKAASALGPQLAAGQAELDELLLRHQTREHIQPLSEDPGVSLVAYTTTY